MGYNLLIRRGSHIKPAPFPNRRYRLAPGSKMKMLVNAVATMAARFTIYRNKVAFESGRLTYQSIYFQLGKALELPESDIAKRVSYLVSQRYKCPDAASVPDIIIRDSLNQFAALLPGFEGDLKDLIKDMLRNSYQSMACIRNLVMAKKAAN